MTERCGARRGGAGRGKLKTCIPELGSGRGTLYGAERGLLRVMWNDDEAKLE